MANKRPKQQSSKKAPNAKPSNKPSTPPAQYSFATWMWPAVAAVLLPLGLLFAWTFFSDFVPSAGWEDLARNISLEITAIVSLAWYWALWTGRINLSMGRSWRDFIGGIVVVPMFTFALMAITLARGAGDLANRIVGTTETVEMQFERRQYDAEDECLNLVGTAGGKAAPEEFCLPLKVITDKGQNLRPSFRARLTTVNSRFGRHGFKVDVVPALPVYGSSK